MLVLSRKLGQRFQIGPDVFVTVVRIDAQSVRLGIEAPDGVSIYRQELADSLGLSAPRPVEDDAPLAEASSTR